MSFEFNFVEEELLDPKIDFVFKRIFGDAEHPAPLLDLLNAIFASQNKPLIQEVTLLNPSLNSDWALDKTSILDIRAITCQGDAINVEMQMLNHKGFLKRTLYYWAELYSEHLQKGDAYQRLRRTITINFLNFSIFERARPFSQYQLRECDDHHCLTDLMELVFIELPKPVWGNQPPTLQHWIRFLTMPNSDESKQLAQDHPAIGEAYDMLNYLSHNPEERARYFRRKIALMDQKAYIEDAKEQGWSEGHAEGHATGISEGHATGISEGAQQAKQQTATKMLAMGLSIDLIAEATGLTTAQIQDLGT